MPSVIHTEGEGGPFEEITDCHHGLSLHKSHTTSCDFNDVTLSGPAIFTQDL